MILLFDIGGTKTRVAVSGNEKTIKKECLKIFPTEASYENGLAKIISVAKQLANSEKIEIVCGGIAGPLNHTKEKIIFDSQKPNLKDWVDRLLKKDLEKELGAKVLLENDSALGALGEAVRGTGKNYSIVAYLTIGTGIGGARIVNKKIDKNSLGFEPGKQIIDVDGSIYPEDEPPITLEEVVSGMAIEKRTGQLPSDIKDEKFWEDMAYYLAIGLNDTLVHWSPDVLILGGGLIDHTPLKHTREILAKILTTFEKIPKIKKASLGELSGLYGAMAYLENRN